MGKIKTIILKTIKNLLFTKNLVEKCLTFNIIWLKYFHMSHSNLPDLIYRP